MNYARNIASWVVVLALAILDSYNSMYSCLTSVDTNTVGILYEGSRSRICFQKLDLLEILNASRVSSDDVNDLVSKLENIKSAQLYKFQLKDDKGGRMDCLKVFQPTAKGDVYGVYHAMTGGVLSICLGISEKELTQWRQLCVLDEHGSQATVHVCEDGGFLIAYEKDAPNAVHIRLRYYPDLAALTGGKFSHEYDIARTLAPTAEGTPSFESVKIENSDPAKSEIRMRFHYFENANVDQLAEGRLSNFKSWTSSPLEQLNKTIAQQGGLGNIGDRDRFTWRGRSYYLQEVQLKRLDWGSWRTFLCDAQGSPIKQLAFKTPGGSVAFSNSTVTRIEDAKGRERLVVTQFIHRAGSRLKEHGELIYVIDSE